MRYYRIEITDKQGRPIKDAKGNDIGPWDSRTNAGGVKPMTHTGGALHITLDAPSFGADMLASGAMLVVYGLPIAVLEQAVNLHMATITVYGGFTAGLPLANPAHSGLLVKGVIYSPYGNWQGIYQSLNLPIWPARLADEYGRPFNITMQGKTGERLSDVITRALKTSFPDKDIHINVNIHQNLVLYEDWNAVCRSLHEVGELIQRVTPGMLGGVTFSGVKVVAQKNQINVFDNATPRKPIAIEARDLVGQPTWIEFLRMSLKTTLRADIQVGDWISLPIDATGRHAILAVGSPLSSLNEKQRSTFSGIYEVLAMRHIADFRSPADDAWVTVFEAVPINRTESLP